MGKPWELSTVPLSLSVCCGSRGVHGHGRFDAEAALLLCVSPPPTPEQGGPGMYPVCCEAKPCACACAEHKPYGDPHNT